MSARGEEAARPRIGRLFGAFAPRPAAPQPVAIAGLEEYQAHRRRTAGRERRRRRTEARLAVPGERFTVSGFCHPCRRPAAFTVGWEYAHTGPDGAVPNWREHLFCPRCGLNNRMRAAVHLLDLLAAPARDATIYLTEQVTPLHTALAARFERLVGSEFVDPGLAAGSLDRRGIRHEDLTALSFADGRFDCVLTFDVAEHVPDYRRGFAECLRVLRPGGRLLFTVPFAPERAGNLLRARPDGAGGVEHLEPPEYHYDPVHPEGCLAFHLFGWELFDDLRALGFAGAAAWLYWSRRFGYLGPDQMLFSAVKPPAPAGR